MEKYIAGFTSMTNRSNLHGRVLEYLITEEIIKMNSIVKLTEKAKEYQNRDSKKLAELDSSRLLNMKTAASAVLYEWLEPKFELSKKTSITLDRLPDQNKSDVTDICLKLEALKLNLSIKHNHTALKHQRPNTTPLHCGYAEDGLEMQQFTQEYKAITQKFRENIGEEKCFAELSADSRLQHLYTPVCNLVSKFINQCDSTHVSNFFNYLVGGLDYYKVVVYTKAKTLSIQHFEQIQPPTMVEATVTKQYVNLNFNNQWKISMRLHTASKKLKESPSLKFDTQALKKPISDTIIHYA